MRWRALIILVTVLVAGAVAWRVTSGMIERDMGMSRNEVESTPSSIASLLGKSAGGDVDDMVFLNDVRLQAGPKPHVFVVSGAKGIRMLVVSEGGILAGEHMPTTVDIKGRICRMPSLAILRKAWKLSKDQIRIFGHQKVYIAAEYVKRQELNAKAD
jgi:hypothetical protein